MKNPIASQAILIATPLFTLLLTILYLTDQVSFSFLADEIGSQAPIINQWSKVTFLIGSTTMICLLFKRYLAVRYMLSGLFISIVVLQLPPTVLWLIFLMLSIPIQLDIELIITAVYHGIIIILGLISLKINVSYIQNRS